MYRTHHCGALRIQDVNTSVTLAGWVQKSRDMGGLTFVDLRDRYGITQLTFNMETQAELCAQARTLGREYVIQATGTVIERSSKNKNLPTGDIEIQVTELKILNAAKTPPFTIENDTDGGDELRMKYRYLDMRRDTVKNNIIGRHQVAQAVREYLNAKEFLEIETPFLIKSTPEGARDFVVPSRLNPGQFYALPQSPQTFKQLLMVSGFDKYYQIVRCMRDEDLRADRQPEFTQIDCEMSFVEQEDILQNFTGMFQHLFKKIRNIDIQDIPRMTYDHAMQYYGNDKPDIRFEMLICDLAASSKIGTFQVFDNAEAVLGICARGCGSYTRKQLDEITDWVKRPQIGMGGMAWLRYNEDGSIKASFEKFYTQEQLRAIADACEAGKDDLVMILAGDASKTRKAMSELRLEMGNRLGLRNKNTFAPLWVVDFPMFEHDAESGAWFPAHHPFTSPKAEGIQYLFSDPGIVRANCYDFVLNGVELASGSIRIHDRDMQMTIFKAIGLSEEEANEKFGFIMNAFEYGAPPHGGIAFGFDRLCALLLSGNEYIRDFIAFPKNNSGRDVMLDAPAPIDAAQCKELSIQVIV